MSNCHNNLRTDIDGGQYKKDCSSLSDLVFMQVDAEEDFGLETERQLKFDRDVHPFVVSGRSRQLPDSVNNIDFSHFRASRKKCKKHYRHSATKRHTNIIHGFTLIELLVVIAIIALLVSILLPSLQTARDLAKAVVCQSNLKGIGTQLGLYTNEYNDAMPGPYAVFYWPQYLSSGEGVKGYEKMYVCPSKPDSRVGTVMELGLSASALGTPAEYNDYATVRGSYCYNSVAFNHLEPETLSSFDNPGNVIYIADTDYAWYSWWPQWDYSWGIHCIGHLMREHKNGTNLLFLDSHVEWMDPDSLLPIQVDPKKTRPEYPW